jgi:hypothetical protein
MAPQLALLSKLDKRAREANVRAAGAAGGGAPADALGIADAVLSRAQSAPGSTMRKAGRDPAQASKSSKCGKTSGVRNGAGAWGAKELTARPRNSRPTSCA